MQIYFGIWRLSCIANGIQVSELAEEQDLRDIFGRFGHVTRVFLARDRETNMAKGFAFISFADRSDAARALDKLDGCKFATPGVPDGVVLTSRPERWSTNVAFQLGIGISFSESSLRRRVRDLDFVGWDPFVWAFGLGSSCLACVFMFQWTNSTSLFFLFPFLFSAYMASESSICPHLLQLPACQWSFGYPALPH